MAAYDIVIPHNNEQAFIDIALKLGLRQLCFLYPPAQYRENTKKDYGSALKITFGILAQPNDVLKAKGLSSMVVVARSSDSFEDRLVIEKFRPSIIYNLETSSRKDFMHQRNSGLNHVLCMIAHDNNVAIGFNYSLLQHKERMSVMVGRMMQNMMLCKKYKLKTVFASFATDPWQLRSKVDVESLVRIL